LPKVVVVSPYYNRANYVDRTMCSMREQTYADFVSYFIDDGSKDDTYEQMLKFASDKVIPKRQDNCGFVDSLINMINSTESDYIAIQGSGDVSLPQRLERQAAFLDANPGHVVVGCHREMVSERTGRKTVISPIVPNDPFNHLQARNLFSHGEVMMRRSAYEKAGGYRSFFTYRQDLDLWLRMLEQGHLAVLPDVLYRTYVLSESVSTNVRKETLAIACRHFAVYCARERRAGRSDPLQERRALPALLRPRSAALANDLSKSARRRALRGDMKDARFASAAALGEKLTLSGLATAAMVHMPGLEQAGDFARRLLLKPSQRALAEDTAVKSLQGDKA